MAGVWKILSLEVVSSCLDLIAVWQNLAAAKEIDLSGPRGGFACKKHLCVQGDLLYQGK